MRFNHNFGTMTNIQHLYIFAIGNKRVSYDKCRAEWASCPTYSSTYPFTKEDHFMANVPPKHLDLLRHVEANTLIFGGT